MTINGKASDIAKNIKCHNFNTSIDDIYHSTDWFKQSSAVVCDDQDRLFGIISESDIIEAQKLGTNLKSLKSWELCSHNMITVTAETDISEVIKVMLDNKIHHVLILEEDDKCSKIISSLDILEGIK